jgi:hypothetical protein
LHTNAISAGRLSRVVVSDAVSVWSWRTERHLRAQAVEVVLDLLPRQPAPPLSSRLATKAATVSSPIRFFSSP